MTHTIATALIVNKNGGIFVQRRSPTRRLFPGCWDLAGGHVDPGETVENALTREVFEETGWTVDALHTELSPKTWQADDGPRLERQFIVTTSGDLSNPTLETGKVDAWSWIDHENLATLKENRSTDDTFVHDSVLEALNWLNTNG
jgi:8-oxo-dGTP pyrophosphatase MutT (NUDIX family)